jgi:hypothetical protein
VELHRRRTLVQDNFIELLKRFVYLCVGGHCTEIHDQTIECMIDFEVIIKSSKEKSPLLSIILYTDRHPHIKKCLRDDDYWKAFDESSGKNWIIMSVKPKQGTYKLPNFPKGVIGMMIQIWEEPADNKPLIEFLEIDDTQNLPMIFFYKLKDSEIEDDIYVKIEGKTEEEIYNDLQDIISKVSKAIEKDGDFFENAKSTIRKEKVFRTIKKGKKILSDFNGLIPGIF